MWQHRREVNHDPPKDVNKTVKLDLLLPEERIKLGHLKCEICANFYPHKRSLRRHMNKVHKDLLPKWNCPICDAEFETSTLFVISILLLFVSSLVYNTKFL